MAKKDAPKFVNPLAIVVKNSEVEVFIKDISTGLVLDIKPASDPSVKAVETEHRKESFRIKRDGGDPMEHVMDHVEDRMNDRVVAHVAGWKWREGVDATLAALTYSEEQLREFLAAVPFGDAIRAAVMKHIERDENFFVMPAAG